MVYLNDDINIDLFVQALKAANQKQVFQNLAHYAAQENGLDQNELTNALITAENKGSFSGIGNGVAIPQLILKDLKQPFCLFARLPKAIDYNSLDNVPVDLVLFLLSPEKDGPLHLQRLSRLSRMMRDTKLCQSLRGADSVDALRALLINATPDRLAA